MLHGIDLSRWQAGLRISDLPASVAFVNISISRGITVPTSIDTQRGIWASEARRSGRLVTGYHWLDASATGAEQWAVCKREALKIFGSLQGWGLQVDCESDATFQHVIEFGNLARRELGRPVAFYSGDWWLDRNPSWPALAGDFPYLWATANAGWLPSVPDERSLHWRWAGRGGWSHLSLLQWSDTQKIAGIAVSSTVVRNLDMFCSLIGTHAER